MVSTPHHPGPIFLSMLVCEHPLLIGLPNIHTILWEWFCHAKRREYHFPHFGYHVFINTTKDHMIFPGRHIELLYSLLKRPMLFTHTSSKSCPHINIPVWSSHLQVRIFMSPPSISFCWHLFTVPASSDHFGSGFSDLLVSVQFHTTRVLDIIHVLMLVPAKLLSRTLPSATQLCFQAQRGSFNYHSLSSFN